jgi:PAS domain S-box-containing protein
VQTEIKRNRSELRFEALPSFAAWLLEHHLQAFCLYQISLYKELEIPLLKLFEGYSEAQLLQISMATNTEFLTYLAQNDARAQINEGIRKWKANTLPNIDKNTIVAEDITYVTYVRKQAFLHFIPGYITDVPEMLQLIGEIDLFLMESETVSTNTHVNILKEELTENLHLLQKINNTLPGAVYVFDIQKYKGVYSNQNLASVIGHTQDELNVLGSNALPQLIHPDDMEETMHNLAQVRTAADGEIKTYKYRVRDKEGVYHWIRSYESPFKRAEDGTVSQTIGITLNIDTEEQLAETLREREAQYKKAEDLANLGHFSYDMATKKIEWTDQLYHIYELEPQSEAMTLQRFLSFVHPDDKEAVLQIKETLFSAHKTSNSFRIITAKGKEKTIRSITELQLDKQDRPVKVIGAEQDITEKQSLIEQLKHSESLYKQAQALTHVGNWSWNIDTGEVEWSDELYHIYELPVGQKQTYDTILSYAHPEDRDAIVALLNDCIENKTTYDKHHRIVLPDGRIKTIHRRAEVLTDGNGRVTKLVGTTQDVTERQRLISRLEQSEALYKQAQEIAQVGNWIYDVASTNVTWSDEVYKILGLLPQSQALNWQLLFDMMHPNDQEEAAAVLQNTIATGQPFEMYHRVRRADGGLRMLHVRGEVVPGPDGKPVRLIGTAQDVTQQKKIEQELRDNQMFIKKIADATPSIIASYNVHTGYYAFINEGLKKLLGYDTQLVIEKGAAFFAEIIHPDDLEPLTQKNNRVLEEYNRPEQRDDTQAIVEFTYRMRHQNGSYRWFQTYGTIFDRNADGRIEHVLNISLDITEQVESAQIIKTQEHFIKHIADASPTILYLV